MKVDYKFRGGSPTRFMDCVQLTTEVSHHIATCRCVATYQKKKAASASDPNSMASSMKTIAPTNHQSLLRPRRASSADTVARLRNRFMLRMLGFHHASNRSPPTGTRPTRK